jgi:hypothetical protein
MDIIIASYPGTEIHRSTIRLSLFRDPQKKLIVSLQVFPLCCLNMITLTTTEIIRSIPEFNRVLVCPPGGCFYGEMPGPDVIWYIAAILLTLCAACAFVFVITAHKRCVAHNALPKPSILLKRVFLGYFPLALIPCLLITINWICTLVAMLY